MPQNPYGDRVGQAFTESVASNNAKIDDVERFNPSADKVDAQTIAIAKTNPDAILIAQGGIALRSIASMLGTNGIDTTKVKLLGTGLWYDPALTKEGSLEGGWFAAPAPHAQDAFDAKYRSVFDSPRRSLRPWPMMRFRWWPCWRRVSLTIVSHAQPLSIPMGLPASMAFSVSRMTARPNAVLRSWQVEPDGFQVIRPAPTTFQPVGD